MPGGDRTGPMGRGSMTGRGAGYCAGFPSAGYAKTIPERGFARNVGGRGFGKNFGCRGGFRWINQNVVSSVSTSQEEAKLLRRQASLMKNEMDSINGRIKELESRVVQENK